MVRIYGEGCQNPGGEFWQPSQNPVSCLAHFASLAIHYLKELKQNRPRLAHVAESSEQNGPVPFSADGFIGVPNMGTNYGHKLHRIYPKFDDFCASIVREQP